MKSYQITVQGRDSEDGCFVAVLLVIDQDSKTPTWYNSGIVHRDPEPEKALLWVHEQAIERLPDYAEQVR